MSMNEKVAWTQRELKDPHRAVDKAQRVRAMFAAIAPRYDLNNRLHSLWRDQAWRRKAVKMAGVRGTDVVLDVACGTGDLAFAFVRGGAGEVWGVDFTPEMLLVAEAKAVRGGEGVRPKFLAGDATALPLPDRSVDVVTIAFGIRNVAEPGRAMAEFYRVLRPGGRVVVLEFSLPRNRWLRGGYEFYFNRILPRTAGWIARDRSGAYEYLPRSVNTFLGREQMQEMLVEAGFKQVVLKSMTMGIAVIYRGVKQG